MAAVSYEPAQILTPYVPEEVPDAELQQTRLYFSSLDKTQKDILDPYVHVILGDQVALAAGDMRPSDYLVESDGYALHDFLAGHHQYLDTQRADPHIASSFEFFKSSYLHRLESGVQEGWVSDDARGLFDVIGRTSLEVGDIRETRLEWKVGRFVGYSNKMVIAQGIEGGDYRDEVILNLRDSLPHELSHRFSRWLPRWASEALAEQLGLVVQYGEPEVFHADLRSHEKSRFYNAESALMHALLTTPPDGDPELPLMALRAFTSEGPDSEEWQRFHETLDKAWGTKDVFSKVSALVGQLEKEVAVEHSDWVDMQVEPEAVTRAMYTLLHNQTRVFGHGYKPAGRHRRLVAQAGKHRR